MNGKLPHKFTENMKKLLGSEFDNFMSSYGDQRLYGLRINELKLEVDEWRKLSPFGSNVKPIPWSSSGLYYQEEERPGKHPHYHAGLYYIQEPSAMAPVELLDVQPGHRVLDLCAAPGGKSTQIAAKLQGSGVLVTNDNARERTKALAKNIELAGVRNAVVLNEEPERLAPVFAEWFDRILIDAPCSGEGMFRKDDSMIADWEKHSVSRCAVMQRDILRHAAAMLAPGGMLVYSTCTFSPEENEQQIAAFLAEYDDFSVMPIEHRYGFQPGRPDQVEAHVLNETARLQSLAGTVRLWPHHLKGEGHYAAVLRRNGERPSSEQAADQIVTNRTGETVTGAKGPAVQHKSMDHRLKRIDKQSSGSEFGSSRKKDRKSGGRGIAFEASGSKRERTAAEEESPEQLWSSQSAHILGDSFACAGRLVTFGTRLYIQPDGVPALDGLRVVRAGWYVGEADKGRLTPTHPLAMGLKRNEAVRSINWRSEQPETLRYLKGETVFVEESELDLQEGESAKGYVLVCTDGFPIGWAKFVGGMLKNELPAGWRWM